MKTIVYFHGYNSNRNTDKVARIKELRSDCKVLAFDADINPFVAIRQVKKEIIIELLLDFSNSGEIVFVGTSLGAWLASELSDIFECRAILINPCFDPEKELAKLGVDEDICLLYTKMSLKGMDRKTIYASPDDEVIDHSELFGLAPVVRITGDHRCNGKEFTKIIDSI